MQIQEMISAIQRELGIHADGQAGPQTWGAIYERLVGNNIKDLKPSEAIAQVDSRSEKVIATLLPEVRPVAYALVQKAAAAGITIKIISGLRTNAEQDALYAKRRNPPGGKTFTKAKGGYSCHNFSFAFDIVFFDGKVYLQQSPKYMVVGALGEDLGLEWGWNWKTFPDKPHFQLRPAWVKGLASVQMLAELRSRHDNGQYVYA